MKNQLIVAACVVATCCSSVVFASAPVHPKQGEKPKTAVKPTSKTMAAGSKVSTTTKHTKHTKKS